MCSPLTHTLHLHKQASPRQLNDVVGLPFIWCQSNKQPPGALVSALPRWGNTTVPEVVLEGTRPQPGLLHLQWQTTPPPPPLSCCTTTGGSQSLPGPPSPISLSAKWRGWNQWLLRWLFSHVNVARPWCPGMWSNIILDVYVRVFWVRLSFNLWTLIKKTNVWIPRWEGEYGMDWEEIGIDLYILLCIK